MVLVGVERGGDVAVAQLVERGRAPTGGLAAVDGELGGSVAEGVDGGGEPAAGVDLGELVVVADEDHLRPRRPGGGDDPVQVDGAGHPGLVDDDDVRGGRVGGGVAAEAGEREGSMPAPSASSRAARAEGATPTTR